VGYAQATGGTNIVPVVATDYSSNSRTNNYQIVVTNNGVAKMLTYDLNGNLTNAVTATTTNSYEWDAVNRLTRIIQIPTAGPQLISEFTYDGLGRRVRIVEKTNDVVQSDKRFLWCGMELSEERDATGATVNKRLFVQGEETSGANYFFTRDHLGSVREMTSNTGAIMARYEYDPYGRRTTISGGPEAEFGFTGHYYHQASGLHLALYRAYDAENGRWLNRDPISERGGINLYNYVGNDPIDWIDPFGLEKGAELLMRMNNGYGGLNPFFGKIWNAPNTAIGLVWGGLGVPFGAKPHFGNNALQFTNHPFMFGGDITIGNTICYNKFAGPNVEMEDQAPYLYGDHERQHTYQGEQLGPFYLPANLFGGITSLLTTGSWHGNNFMERGPLSVPPVPWPNGRMR
jgi:RHS repeat-associated protein